ncbi:MAG: cysteine--tRNA ligase [Candidatus Peregrinibacteria bacterium]|nr:cysteine--tRNA ligase [Candidatus Peregrinibacteria bacterium]
MIKIYDTLTAKKVDFVPLEEGKVGIYVCGPTVYDSAHLGHGRSAVSFDVIRRYFIYRGYEVKYVSNYTDIDDKMITRAKQEDISVKELSDKVIPIYAKDYGALGVMVPDVQPLATEHVPEMIELIKGLEKQGFTYVLDDGVYYEVAKFKEYGKLSKQKLEDLRVGSRVEVKDGKKSPYDFVLWKFKKEGEPSWSSPWGEGRPGWHIECSAMTWKHLGEKFDIHGGGLDLTFPHHECEIAQSEPVFGHGSFSKYWMHNGFINVDNEKMSKSLGNFFTLKEIFEKYDPKVVRFMFLQTHYRNPVNFSNVLLDQAKAGLSRLHDFVRNLNALLDAAEDGVVSVNLTAAINVARSRFEGVMDDDFDTSGALGAVYEFVKEVNVMMNNSTLNKIELSAVLNFLQLVDKVLGVIFVEETSIDSDVEKLIEKRNFARKNRDFKTSDFIRDQLLEKGIVLEDKPQGTIWKKV